MMKMMTNMTCPRCGRGDNSITLPLMVRGQFYKEITIKPDDRLIEQAVTRKYRNQTFPAKNDIIFNVIFERKQVREILDGNHWSELREVLWCRDKEVYLDEGNIWWDDEEANRFPRPLDINKFRNRPDHLKEAGDERVKKGFSFLKAERQSENLGSGITTSASDTRTDITELQRVMVAKSKFLAEGFKPTHLLVTKEIFERLIAEVSPEGTVPENGIWDSICLRMRVEALEKDLDIIMRQKDLGDDGKTVMSWDKYFYCCNEPGLAGREMKVNHD